MEKTFCTIIGAGSVGLAIASELAHYNNSLFVLDRQDSYGRETSSRNSEVIHSGLYYDTGSLKHILCIKGNRHIYEWGDKYGIPVKKTGKLVVASDIEDELTLEELLSLSRQNGINAEMLTSEQVKALEPDIVCRSALYVKDTGIMDTHSLMKHMYSEAKNNGAEFVFNTEITAIECSSEGYVVTVKDNTGEVFSFISEYIVNSAGLDADTVCKMAAMDTAAMGYDLHYCKGSYFSYSGKELSSVKKLVYPAVAPKSESLGIHITFDIGGRIKFGPDKEYIKVRKKDYEVDVSKKSVFYEAVKKYIPGISIDEFIPDMSGIRPKLQAPGEGFRDFVIKEEKESGFPCFINLIGLESPGLTASPAIGKYVLSLIKNGH